ncbi:unnamed protein product [Zymoseptoria tritici ST99CH_1A5]|uniref:Uncharacterized protein n=3 Tax=Zymoseptoria tritici TaxID=1047171 RepID=F9XET1_ZYMTI|nr:uncharacterized protein MYCGRDRAFT_94715 [Zymoseptoria tritici IPO323]EGP85975.1 hypothetical protein MYCGRDRAFT_94715 [Zymoseptoria tritici IPO323]SMR55610.1 unnamed protein product [Zymoseptoria tritici ST99CH_1E4]SMY26425.1 unnamed protein product [Zymoseptoria tritici ST99CH_1A5]
MSTNNNRSLLLDGDAQLITYLLFTKFPTLQAPQRRSLFNDLFATELAAIPYNEPANIHARLEEQFIFLDIGGSDDAVWDGIYLNNTHIEMCKRDDWITRIREAAHIRGIEIPEDNGHHDCEDATCYMNDHEASATRQYTPPFQQRERRAREEKEANDREFEGDSRLVLHLLFTHYTDLTNPERRSIFNKVFANEHLARDMEYGVEHVQDLVNMYDQRLDDPEDFVWKAILREDQTEYQLRNRDRWTGLLKIRAEEEGIELPDSGDEDSDWDGEDEEEMAIKNDTEDYRTEMADFIERRTRADP